MTSSSIYPIVQFYEEEMLPLSLKVLRSFQMRQKVENNCCKGWVYTQKRQHIVNVCNNSTRCHCLMSIQISSNVPMGRSVLTRTRFVMVCPSVRTVLMNCTVWRKQRAVSTSVTVRVAACPQTSSVMERGTVLMALTKKTAVGWNHRCFTGDHHLYLELPHELTLCLFILFNIEIRPRRNWVWKGRKQHYSCTCWSCHHQMSFGCQTLQE